MNAAVEAGRMCRYVAVRAFRGMTRAPQVQLLAVATTAACMLLLATVLLAWVNARGVADAWGLGIPVTVYLHDEAPVDSVRALIELLLTLPEVSDVREVTPAEAMTRLVDGLGADASALEGVEAEVLPTTLELHVREGTPTTFTAALGQKITAFDVVEDVEMAGGWAVQAQALLATLGDLAVGVAALVGLASMAIIWNTIRLAVHARRHEIQIVRLVGGSSRFVRGPFMLEGCVQGCLGACVALALLYAAFDALYPFLEQGLALVFVAGTLRFFSPLEIAVGIAAGAAVGLLGARVAAGRYVET